MNAPERPSLLVHLSRSATVGRCREAPGNRNAPNTKHPSGCTLRVAPLTRTALRCCARCLPSALAATARAATGIPGCLLIGLGHVAACHYLRVPGGVYVHASRCVRVSVSRCSRAGKIHRGATAPVIAATLRLFHGIVSATVAVPHSVSRAQGLTHCDWRLDVTGRMCRAPRR